MMLSQLLDRVGEQNPQLFRELKGRLIPRNIYLVMGFSLIVQTLITIVASGSSGIYWEGVFQTLHHLIPLLVLPSCVYFVSVDLIKEEQRGTLNFVKLSPQPSTTILAGKVWGVPCLVFLAALSAIPLHFIAGINEGLNGAFLICVYLFWLLSSAGFSIVTIGVIQNTIHAQQLIQKHGLLQGTAAFSALGALMFASMYCSFFNLFTAIYENDFLTFRWFFLPVGGNFFLGYLWLMATIAAVTYGCWIGINRRFRNLNQSIYTKRHSYLITAVSQLWVLGFFVPIDPTANFNNSPQVIGLFWAIFACPIILMMVNQTISPSRQYLLEWSRYRNRRQLWPDLLWGEKSPTTIALALNIAIVAGIWSLWLIALPNNFLNVSEKWVNFTMAWMALLLAMGAVFLYGLGHQWLLILMKPHPQMKVPTETQATVLTMVLMGVPVVIAIGTGVPLFWAVTPFPALALIGGKATIGLVVLALQLILGTFLFYRFNHSLKRMGRSETKDLLTSSNLTRAN